MFPFFLLRKLRPEKSNHPKLTQVAKARQQGNLAQEKRGFLLGLVRETLTNKTI